MTKVRLENPTAIPEFPLEGNKTENVFKLYFADVGLLVGLLDKGTAGHILMGDLGIYKGAIYEESFADAYLKRQKPILLFQRQWAGSRFHNHATKRPIPLA